MDDLLFDPLTLRLAFCGILLLIGILGLMEIAELLGRL